MKKTGDEYFDSGEFRDMLKEYEEAVGDGQPVFLDADELAEIADYYQMTEQPDEAERAISLALGLSPGAIAPLTYRIHEALWQGDTTLARSYLEQIVERDEPDYVYDKGEILIAEDRADEANEFFREEFKKVPPDEYQDYVIDVANIFQDYGENELAMQWMARAKHEDSPSFKELMARTLYGLGKYKDSEKLFNELVDQDPFSKYYWTALASAQFMNEDYSASVESSEYAIAIDPDDAEGIIAKANALYQLGNFDEALKYFERYCEHVGDDDYAILHRATCLINLGRTDEAIAILENAITQIENSEFRSEMYDIIAKEVNDESPRPTMDSQASEYLPDLLQELAFAYSEKGDIDRAMELLDRTDRLECDHAQLNVVKGHILLSDGRMEEAEKHYREAVLNSDEPNQTLLRVIVSIYDNRYLEAAYELFRKYFSIIDKDCCDGYAYMALCCYDMKNDKEFLHYLREACRLNPKECRMVLAHLFPEDVEPKDYYDYIVKQMKGM